MVEEAEARLLGKGKGKLSMSPSFFRCPSALLRPPCSVPLAWAQTALHRWQGCPAWGALAYLGASAMMGRRLVFLPPLDCLLRPSRGLVFGVCWKGVRGPCLVRVPTSRKWQVRVPMPRPRLKSASFPHAVCSVAGGPRRLLSSQGWKRRGDGEAGKGV